MVHDKWNISNIPFLGIMHVHFLFPLSRDSESKNEFALVESPLVRPTQYCAQWLVSRAYDVLKQHFYLIVHSLSNPCWSWSKVRHYLRCPRPVSLPRHGYWQLCTPWTPISTPPLPSGTHPGPNLSRGYCATFLMSFSVSLLDAYSDMPCIHRHQSI